MGVLPAAVSVVAAVAFLPLYYFTLAYLGSVSDVTTFTSAQLGAAAAYGALLAAWVGVEIGFLVERLQPRYVAVDAIDAGAEEEAQELAGASPSADAKVPEPSVLGFPRSKLPALRAAAEFVFIMGYVYVCDRTRLIPKGPKEVSPARFWALNGGILLAALCTLRPSKPNPDGHYQPLQREQTEEWKGWMQLMFILYHYFAYAQIYNAIRLYIAAYVWMTGFGNFSYYYIKKDFTVVRFAQMMWRLNFFVFFICITMNNEYMLYYICPMHTFFTWLVYLTLWIGNHLNSNSTFLFFKICVVTLLTLGLYHFPGLFSLTFGPALGLLGFHDPLHPETTDPMHEWYFRSGLDHMVWIFGMLCAFCFPWYDTCLDALEGLGPSRTPLLRLGLLGVSLGVGYWWYECVFVLPKREYNAIHPYSSWLPILLYMLLRNLTPSMRNYSMHLLTWCGKVTLETYILQFHIWMKTTGLNGSPKHLMVWVPGWYWTNFALTSAVFLAVSYRVFHITVVLRDACIPKDLAALGVRAAVAGVGIGAFYLVGCLLQP